MSETTETNCPDCRGTGQIALLTSVQICQKCRGTGLPHVDGAARVETIDNGYRVYDSQNRLVSEVTEVEAGGILYNYPSSEPAT